MRSRVEEAKRVTWIGFAVNIFLTVFKIIIGFVSKSTAMVADGMHSLSDFVTDLLVILFIGISDKERDEDHRYGHGKYETFATMLICFTLILVAIGIFWSGLSKMILFFQGSVLEQPTYWALIAAFVSILFKEILFWHTRFIGNKINSDAVVANAWHHRSDSFSSIAAALGISGAIFLGEPWRILDPLAAVLVGIFIVRIAFKMGISSVHELLERSLPQEIESAIIKIIESHPDVIFQHNLKTRKIGNVFAIDVHVKLDKNISFIKSHDIATDIEVKLREKFGEKTITNIHTEPYKIDR